MAVRSVLEIDVNDDSFKAFLESFNRYQDVVKALPGSWGKVDAAASGAADQSAAIAAALLAQNELLHKANRETDRLGRSSHAAHTVMHKLAGATRTIYHNIESATKSLLKWSSIAGTLGGLVGFGGLFGIDRLAAAAASGRRSSMGLGTTYGQQKAFGTDFGRFVNPDQFLSGVNTGATDITSPEYRGMRALGISPLELATGNTAQIGVDTLKALKAFVDRTPAALLGPELQAFGLSGLISSEDARRLKSTSPQEFQQQLRAYQRDQAAFQPQAAVLKKWQDLSTQLDRAKTKIQTVLIDGLTPLSGPLKHLSDSFTDAVKAFLKTPEVKQWITNLAHGLEQFAIYVKSPQFHTDVTNFMKDVGRLAKDIVGVVNWVEANVPSGILAGAAGGAIVGGAVAGPAGAVVGGAAGAAVGSGLGTKRYQGPPSPLDHGKQPFSWWNPGSWLHHSGAPDPVQKFLWGLNPFGSAHAATEPGGMPGSGGPTAPLFSLPGGRATPLPDEQMKKLQPIINQLEKLGWSPKAAEGIAANVWKESYANPRAVGDSGLAYGIGQWHADRQALFAKWAGHPIQGSSLAEQIRFINYELRHGDAGAKAAGHMLETARSAAEAAAIISRYYERPAAKQREMNERAALAARIHAGERQSRMAGSRHAQSRAQITVRNQTGGSAVITGAALAGT